MLQAEFVKWPRDVTDYNYEILLEYLKKLLLHQNDDEYVFSVDHFRDEGPMEQNLIFYMIHVY